MMMTNALVKVLQEITTAAALFPALKYGLFTNSLVVTPNLVIADLTLPTYTGYAAQLAGDLGLVYDDAAGDAVQSLDAAIFQPTDAAVSDVIVGWFLFNDGAPDVLLRVELLENPVTLAGPTDALVIQGSWGIGQPTGLPAGYP